MGSAGNAPDAQQPIRDLMVGELEHARVMKGLAERKIPGFTNAEEEYADLKSVLSTWLAAADSDRRGVIAKMITTTRGRLHGESILR